MGIEEHIDLEILRKESAGYFKTVHAETDRGRALVTAAFLDETLKRLLMARISVGGNKKKKFVQPLFDIFGPLSSFSAKIRICYAIGLISETVADDLDAIRRIRNEFAHSLIERSFEDSPIKEWISELKVKINSQDDRIRPAKSNGIEKAVSSKKSTHRFSQISGKIGGYLQASVVIAASDMPEAEKLKIFAALGSEE